MTLVDVAADPLPMLAVIRAAADVLEVDQGGGFCASVLLPPGATVAVARLDRSLRGAPHEGAVLRQVMLATTGIKGPGYFRFAIHSELPG